ncbi:hypothetical protein [Methylacidimicrobium cyclopophantes]|uniref:hypothetical protein n=1 Tax=Methylacidimicrobium cyclopophantes TaxID=1041766 RepID=UPI0015B641BD|nr:hypothetical protein [Methylacidimicrobium cyclopophantes]
MRRPGRRRTNGKGIEFRCFPRSATVFPREKAELSSPHFLCGKASVKDRIESQGIPQTEVDWILGKLSASEQQMPLTRDAGLLLRAALPRGCWLRETEIRPQLSDLLRRVDRRERSSPFPTGPCATVSCTLFRRRSPLRGLRPMDPGGG